MGMTIGGANNVVEVSEWLDHTLDFDFELKANWTQRHDFMVADGEEFVLFSVDGVLGTDEDVRVLQPCVLTVQQNQKVVYRMRLDHITVHDSVVEARLDRLEKLVDAVVDAELDAASDDPIERQLALRQEALRRLGWTPFRAVDQRRLTTPVRFASMERCTFIITCDSSAPTQPLRFRLTARGMRKRPVS